MIFAHKQLLWLLLVFPPAMVAFFWWSWRKRQELLTQFIETRLLPGLLAGVSPTRRKIRWACLVLATVFIIIALARPQWGFTLQEVKQRGLDIVVAIDTSKSMLAEDIAPNRLQRAKLAALDLMQQAKSDRLGLVTFAGSAFLQCPLTFDDAAFRQSVEMLDVNTIPQGGTALADAIDTALTAFKEEDNFKTLVLFTDGEDQDSGALEAAQRAAKAGLRIYTIGIGSAEGELLRIKDNKGRTDYIRDDAGNVVKSRLNENLLREIAGATEGGFYLPLRGAKAIDALYTELAKLPKSEHQEKSVKQYTERYHWPLALSIALLAFEMLFPERKRESAVRRSSVGETTRASEAVALLLLLALPLGLKASPSSAMRDYKAGKFAHALKQYEELIEKNPADLRLQFNAGAAAYRATNYDAAVQHFSRALSATDLRLQQAAYFNLGNTQFRLGQNAKDLDAMQHAWEAAVKSFQAAVTLDKNDKDAAYNLELAKRGVEMIVQLREAVRMAKQAADENVRQRNYHRALEIMQSLDEQNPFAKPFQDFTKKLKDVDEIETPHQPQP